MTRAARIAKAKRLRREGLSYGAIAEKVGVGKSTVQKWLKPKWAQEMNRRSNSNRAAAKRRHEYESECPACGGAKNRYRARCEVCCVETVRRVARERTERFIAMREEGLLNYEIAEREGITTQAVTTVLSKADRYGLEVPPSPYLPTAIREAA